MRTASISTCYCLSSSFGDRLIGKYTGPGSPEIIRRVEELAKKKNATMAQIALAWSLSKDGVTAPIVGTTKLDNLKELIG